LSFKNDNILFQLIYFTRSLLLKKRNITYDTRLIAHDLPDCTRNNKGFHFHDLSLMKKTSIYTKISFGVDDWKPIQIHSLSICA